MNTGGEAAEQIVRMSLEGFEVAAKITGAGAKNIAILLYSILKEEKKTKGKARLTSMLRSGKELKVFTVKRGDLQKFTQEAKKYGVLYCVLADRKNKDPNAEVDVIARAEDASKISRIVERFNLASVDTASIVTTASQKSCLATHSSPAKMAFWCPTLRDSLTPDTRPACVCANRQISDHDPSLLPSSTHTIQYPPLIIPFAARAASSSPSVPMEYSSVSSSL